MSEMDWQNWFFDFEDAKQASAQLRKPILLQFHRERCSGCKKMYAVTYPDEAVHQELHQWFVPVRLDILKDRLIRSTYAAVWTPSFYVVDKNGKMYYSIDGFLNPEDFRVVMRLGVAEYWIPHGKYKEARQVLQKGLEHFPNNPRSATLLFKIGMIEYLTTWDNRKFRFYMQQIQDRYPQSAEARMWPWMD